MQALSKPRMPRRVLTPGQGAEAAPGGFGCKEIGPAGRLARYCAACYVEVPWDERQRALGMLMSWFGEQTTEWVAGECARAGVTMRRPPRQRWASRRPQEYPVRSPDRESGSPHQHRGHRRPRWTYTTSALPKNAQRWYAMGASDSTCSLPIAATHAGTNMQRVVEFTGLRTPRRGRRTRPMPYGGEDV
jgi:hypothetical protein